MWAMNVLFLEGIVMRKNLKLVYGILGSAFFGVGALGAETAAPGSDNPMRATRVESIASVLKAEAPVEEKKKEPVVIFNVPIRRYHEKIANEKMRTAPVVTDMGEVIEEKDGVTFHLRHKQNAVVAPYDSSAAFVSYEALDQLMQKQDYVVAMFELVRDIFSNQLEQTSLRDSIVEQEDAVFMTWVKQGPQEQMDEMNKTLSALTQQFEEKDSKKLEEAFFWFLLGLARTAQDAACCLDASCAAARDAMAYAYGSRLLEKVNGQLEAVRLQVIDWLATHDADGLPSPEWVKYHGMGEMMPFLNGTPKSQVSAMHSKEEWKQLRDTAAKTYLMIADETQQVIE